jgi:hypothetical protein
MSIKPFQLSIVPRDGSNYGVALFQERIGKGNEGIGENDGGSLFPKSSSHIVTVWGAPLHAVTDHLLDVLKRNGYRATDLSRTRKAPFNLDEESGVRLGLLLAAVKPVRKLSRIEDISGALRSMGAEEAYYWFSKCTAGEDIRRAQRALRILLAKE